MSAKTSTQPGRRTPLSLSGAVTKSHQSKSGSNAINGAANSANGHSMSSTNKQDNKVQQQKNEQVLANNPDTNSNKRQQPQTEKKQQQTDNKKTGEKSQNGVNSNKQQQSNENKQQTKEKSQHQNGNNDNKVNEKNRKEKSEKLNQPLERSEKEGNDVKKEDKSGMEKPEKEKEEKQLKDLKDTKEDRIEGSVKCDVKTDQQQQIKEGDKKSKEEKQVEITVENLEKNEIVDEQKSSPIPVTPKSSSKSIKSPATVNKTPTKVNEKTPQKSAPTTTVKVSPNLKREETTTGDDNEIEMEPLAIEGSPVKASQPEEVANINTAPAATSTPGKALFAKRNSGLPQSDVQLAMQTGLSPERPRGFAQISGRKSIRPISDYTPSKFQSNLQFRESYRRINTELDTTNTSMNVTVGSEVTNNLSFSFFGRGRKRDRTPPSHSQSAIGELQTDMEVSPPKKARLDMHGFLSVVSSPLTLLRNRFSKASLQSSTPVKQQQKLNTVEDEIEVQNVSGVSMHEEIVKPDTEYPTSVGDDDLTLEETKQAKLKPDTSIEDTSCEKSCGREQTCQDSDIKITETFLQPAIGDPMAKNKRCIVM